MERWTSILGFFSLAQRRFDVKYWVSVDSSPSDTEVMRRGAKHAKGLSAYAQEVGFHLPGISPGAEHQKKATNSPLREVKKGDISYDDKDCQQ